MADVDETKLPGVGVRHDFATSSGQRLGVLLHRTGHRQLLVYDEDDPDKCTESVRLSEADARTLGELLGPSQVTEHIDEVIEQSIEGLTIDWITLRASSPCAGQTIGDTRLRQQASVTIVAVVRDGTTYPSPGPEFELRSRDIAVVVGTVEGISEAVALLQGS
jgi:TrkA domain protein